MLGQTEAPFTTYHKKREFIFFFFFWSLISHISKQAEDLAFPFSTTAFYDSSMDKLSVYGTASLGTFNIRDYTLT